MADTHITVLSRNSLDSRAVFIQSTTSIENLPQPIPSLLLNPQLKLLSEFLQGLFQFKIYTFSEFLILFNEVGCFQVMDLVTTVVRQPIHNSYSQSNVLNVLLFKLSLNQLLAQTTQSIVLCYNGVINSRLTPYSNIFQNLMSLFAFMLKFF